MPYRKSKIILIYLFLFLLMASLNNKNLNNLNLMKLDEIIIDGLDEKNNLELVENIQSLNINNLFFFNKEQIKEIINSNNLVDKYKIFKHYPSTLIIKIDKTKFLAQMQKEDKNFILGSNGKLIESQKLKNDIPFIFGNFDEEKFFQLKKAIDETNFDYNQIKNLYFFKSGRWDLETNNGVLIKLPKEDIKKMLELLDSFLIKQKKKNIFKIDLRQKNQIIING